MNNVFTWDRYDQIYKHISHRLITGTDRVNKENFERHYRQNFSIISRKINNMTYNFTRFKKVERNDRYVYIPTIRDRIVIEYLKQNVQRKYKIRMENRDKIIEKLRLLLKEPINYYVVRIDIKSFFENVDQSMLIDKLKRNSLFTAQELHLIKNMLSKIEKGVPQGLGISNYLVEIFMEGFDISMRNLNCRVLYYARYVDDIVMLIPGKMTTTELNELNLAIENVFKMYKLTLNENKTQKIYWDITSNPEFDYLGYRFKRNKKELKMEIAANKMKKIYRKIDWMFEQYATDRNYDLLRERLKIFTSVNMIFKTVYVLKRDGSIQYHKMPIMFGINYDYRFVSTECINRINAYIKRCIVLATGISRKNKNALYSLLLKQNDTKYRLIVYSKINTMTLKSSVYKMSGKRYSWHDILCLDNSSLINLYFSYTIQDV